MVKTESRHAFIIQFDACLSRKSLAARGVKTVKRDEYALEHPFSNFRWQQTYSPMTGDEGESMRSVRFEISLLPFDVCLAFVSPSRRYGTTDSVSWPATSL